MVNISDKTIQQIQDAFAMRGTREVRLKIEQGEIVVLAVKIRKVD